MSSMAETSERLNALRGLLETGVAATQEELVDHLSGMGFEVTQSTVSRSLRKLGAIKTVDQGGRVVYRLPADAALPLPVQASLNDLVVSMSANESIIVILTAPGSASLIARQLDHIRPAGILGTLAGDDTIFVAPASCKSIPAAMQAIRESLSTRQAESA